MNYLSAEKIGRNIGEKWLFQNLSFGVLQGEKVALIGANGSGKSTLLNVLSGQTPPDNGELSIRNDIRVGYLDQDPDFQKNKTVFESLFYEENEITKAIFKYENALESGDADAMAESMELIDTLNAWDYEAKVKQILGKLGIQDVDKLISELSGGQQKRVALARVLIEEPDFLILDEPTNHLDLESIEWLEGYLSSSKTTILMVTHDRYFLDKVCNTIMELRNANLYKYSGNYAYFLEKKASQEEIEAINLEKNKALLKKELEWMRRQPKARTTKAQYRIDAFHDLKEKARGPKKEEKLTLSLKSERLGKKIVEIQHISKSFGDKTIISEFSNTFKRGDRIGIVGKNGTGKSTLLNLITGKIKPDQGKIITGETIKIGYYSQTGLEFKENQKIIEYVREIADFIKLADGKELSISNFLTLFLFPPAVQYKQISTLSGGEKRRLQLLKVLVDNPNFLILDEPTNDLDIETLNVLEEFLSNFAGCLIIVSHDRYFMDRLVEHIFAFEGDGKIKDFPGNYTDYRLYAEEQEKEAVLKKKAKTQEIKTKAEAPKEKLTFNEKRELEILTTEIAELEEQKEKVTLEMNSGIEDYEQISALAQKIKDIGNLIEEKELRWLELSEKEN